MALYGEPQWAVVGDTFAVGCSPGPSVVLRDFTFHENPDLKDSRYKYNLITVKYLKNVKKYLPSI